MWLDEEHTLQKRDLIIEQPFVNASGTLGFFPDQHAAPVLSHLGAFVTNPISRRPRFPAANRTCLPYAGGFLLHSGHPNPGISRAIARYKRRWAAAKLPIIIHLLVQSPDDLAAMVRKIEGLENILAVELGLPPNCDQMILRDYLEAGLGELPVIPCVSPEQISLLVGMLTDLGPAAVHLVEPRGALPAPGGELVSGRLYGPAVFPVMVGAAQKLLDAGLRVVANGGIIARWQVDALLSMGVTAVGLGSVLWQVDQGSLFSA